jgi:hypothetical protein
LPSKSIDYAQLKMRIPRHLHGKLESEAQRHRKSLTNEIVLRLVESFEKKTFRTLAEGIQDLQTKIDQMDGAWLRLEMSRENMLMGEVLAEGIEALTAIVNRFDGSPEKLKALTEKIHELAWPVQRLRSTSKALAKIEESRS